MDLTYLKEKVEKVETKKIVDSYGHTKLITNNIKVLQQNNKEYVSVVDFASNTLKTLQGMVVNSVEITELSKANEYVIISKKGGEIIEIRVSHRIDTNENVMIDFRTQSTQLQV